jgi:hypothetical protein
MQWYRPGEEVVMKPFAFKGHKAIHWSPNCRGIHRQVNPPHPVKDVAALHKQGYRSCKFCGPKK